MGKGNPESADVVMARGSKVLVADKPAKQNKSQLERLDVEWIDPNMGCEMERSSKRMVWIKNIA